MIPPRSARRAPSALAAALLLAWAAGPGEPAEAQQASAAPGDVEGGSTPRKTTRVPDLVNRYRFVERYAVDERTVPGSVGTYRVGVVEVLKDSAERAQGGPKVAESTRQTVFVERAAETTAQGIVAGSVRAFERFRVRPEDPSRTMGPRPLEGLTVLYRPKVGDAPLLLSLTGGRTLTDFEFDVASRLPYLPHLPAIFSGQPVRVGDGWKVSRRGAQALLGEPSIQAESLAAKFVELRKEDDGPRKVAVITLAGKATTPSGEATVNAEARFTFEPAEPSRPGLAGARGGEDLVEARGAITELRMTRASGGPLPGPGRLRYQSTREITLERQLGLIADTLPLPKTGPIPTLADPDAWLTLIEPAGRFSVQHPQDFLAPERGLMAPAEPNAAMLVRNLRQGVDTVRVEYFPKTLQPADLKAKLAEKWGATKLEIVKGAEEWLPEGDWPKARVHRIEALVKSPDRPSSAPRPNPKAGAPGPPSGPAPASASASAGLVPRIHFDAYLLQYGQAASVVAIATTSRDAVGTYRREVEQILRSIQLDPPRPAAD